MTRRLWPQSLRARLTLVVITGASVLLVVGMGVLYLVLEHQLRTAVDDGLRARVDDVTALAVARADTPIDDPYAQVLGPDGEVLSASPSAPERPLLGPEQRAAVRDGVVFVDAAVPGLAPPARLAARVVPGTNRIVVVGTSLAGEEAAGDRLLLVLGVALPSLLLMLALVLRWAIRTSLRPVSALTTQAARISTAGSADRLPQPAGRDEIAELASTLNGMLDRLRVSFERERAFVDDASHELRTPIAVLRGELELALLDDDPAQMRRAVEIAQAEAEHLSNLAVDLLLLARQRAGALVLQHSRVDLREELTRAAARLGLVVDVAVSVTGDTVAATVDVARLEQLVTNLVTNAAEAGARHVRLTVTRSDSGALVEVDDDGPGFPDGLLSTVFDRFTRGDAARTRRTAGKSLTGTGLGLAIAASVVRAHGGDISASNDSPLGGARVRIQLPLDGSEPS
ncbi:MULTISPECIES: HAMP domain-containing sensor histidine kinase [Nocardioides]|uniref:histidine kinase n=1 Tax=Nocardioides vastitatis TaxID=2568655 RepID=A0ABW0ZJJ5_9ACTN|nr:ATP-binding protein [Nocardioides sp.]THJ00711.1 HAMP domain-containing protein [Nocardioides sp.]